MRSAEFDIYLPNDSQSTQLVLAYRDVALITFVYFRGIKHTRSGQRVLTYNNDRHGWSHESPDSWPLDWQPAAGEEADNWVWLIGSQDVSRLPVCWCLMCVREETIKYRITVGINIWDSHAHTHTHTPPHIRTHTRTHSRIHTLKSINVALKSRFQGKGIPNLVTSILNPVTNITKQFCPNH